jgi:hypothetical protein
MFSGCGGLVQLLLTMTVMMMESGFKGGWQVTVGDEGRVCDKWQ